MGIGLTVLPHKNTNCFSETGSIDNDRTLTGDVTAGAVVMLIGQSQREAQRPIGPIVAPKHQTIISCWNMRTMAEATQAWQVAKEMKEFGIEVPGIRLSEIRWKDIASVTLQSGEKVVWDESGGTG